MVGRTDRRLGAEVEGRCLFRDSTDTSEETTVGIPFSQQHPSTKQYGGYFLEAMCLDQNICVVFTTFNVAVWHT